MQLSQKLANFTKGQADSLRKAMGKKIKEEMDKLFTLFIDGCVANGHDESKAKKIWADMEKFAQYAFNKSHSTCYALIAYQSAYLKAHYPSEFMAGLMSNNMDKTDDIKKYIEVSKKMGIEVLGPDVNESNYIFTVNDKGHIRFGLSAIKGVGENVIIEMVAIREKEGVFTDIFDFVTRLGSKNANKKVLEALAISGALDCFEELRREQYFGQEDTMTFIEKLIRYANDVNKTTNEETNLFGESFQDMIERPKVPAAKEFSQMERLEKEKEVLGLYMSGHPLDKYKKIINDLTLKTFEEVKLSKKTEYVIGIVKDLVKGTGENQKPYMRFNLLGLESAMQFNLKDKNCEEFGKYIVEGNAIMLKIKSDSFVSKKENKTIEFIRIESVIPENRFYSIINRVVLSIDLTDTHQEIIAKLEYVCKVHQGNIPLILSLETPLSDSNSNHLQQDEIELIEDEENISSPLYQSLEFRSIAFKVDINDKYLADLYEIIGESKVKLII